MEDGYRAYREVIAAGIERLRPNLDVVAAGTDALEPEELERLDPEVVVCRAAAPEGADGRLAWVELPLNPTLPMRVSFGGRRRPAAAGPTLGALLEMVGEAELLHRPERPPGQ